MDTIVQELPCGGSFFIFVEVTGRIASSIVEFLECDYFYNGGRAWKLKYEKL
jgi:hypothetical protein